MGRVGTGRPANSRNPGTREPARGVSGHREAREAPIWTAHKKAGRPARLLSIVRPGRARDYIDIESFFDCVCVGASLIACAARA